MFTKLIALSVDDSARLSDDIARMRLRRGRAPPQRRRHVAAKIDVIEQQCDAVCFKSRATANYEIEKKIFLLNTKTTTKKTKTNLSARRAHRHERCRAIVERDASMQLHQLDRETERKREREREREREKEREKGRKSRNRSRTFVCNQIKKLITFRQIVNDVGTNVQSNDKNNVIGASIQSQ